MGGHTQFGEFISLSEAVKAWYQAMSIYEAEYYLRLSFAQITYNSKTKKYKLAMRFTK